MIEVIDIQATEITDEQAKEAFRTIRAYCEHKRCGSCIFEKCSCCEYFDGTPESWPELE